MSEISDATQIIVVTGRGAIILGELTIKTLALILKVANTVYLAKWKGKTSFKRLRDIKGEEFSFINVGTEDKKILKEIEKEMKAHGIMFARLPDLCGGDGRTQYVIPSSDMVKMKAFLLDHSNGRYRDIKVGPISAADYTMTGVGVDGKETPEMEELTNSAKENVKRKQPLLTTRQLPDITEEIRMHEKLRDQKAAFFERKAVKLHDRWGMFRMPDGQHMVIIPREDIMPDRYRVEQDGKVILPKSTRIAISKDKNYIVVELKSGEQFLSSGKDITAAFGKEDIQETNKRLKEIRKAMQVKNAAQETQRKTNKVIQPEEITVITIHEKMFSTSDFLSGDNYRSRIPFTQSYVEISRGDCKIGQRKNKDGTDCQILTAKLYNNKTYRVTDKDGTVRMVSGSNLKGSYDDKTFRKIPKKNKTQKGAR